MCTQNRWDARHVGGSSSVCFANATSRTTCRSHRRRRRCAAHVLTVRIRVVKCISHVILIIIGATPICVCPQSVCARAFANSCSRAARELHMHMACILLVYMPYAYILLVHILYMGESTSWEYRNTRHYFNSLLFSNIESFYVDTANSDVL